MRRHIWASCIGFVLGTVESTNQPVIDPCSVLFFESSCANGYCADLFWVDTTLTQYVVDSKGFLAGSQLTCEDANKINMRNMMPVPTLRAFDSNMFSDLVRNKRRILDRIRWQFKRFPIAPVSDSVSIMEDLHN
jgi:hypothetical protein